LPRTPVCVPKYQVAGRVVNRFGRSISDAKVTLHLRTKADSEAMDSNEDSLYGSFRHIQSMNHTDENGFDMQVDGELTIESISIKHPRYLPATISSDSIDFDKLGGLVFTLDDFSSWCEGHVTNQNGESIEGATVSVVYTFIDSDSQISGRCTYSDHSARDGRFVLPVLDCASYQLYAELDRARSQTLCGTEGSEILADNFLDLVVDSAGDFNIILQLSSYSDHPLEGWSVESGGVSPRGKTDHEGICRWSNLESRDYAITISDPRGVIESCGLSAQPWADDREAHRISLPAGALLKTVVVVPWIGKKELLSRHDVHIGLQIEDSGEWCSPHSLLTTGHGIQWMRRSRQAIYRSGSEGEAFVVSYESFIQPGVYRFEISAQGCQSMITTPFTVVDRITPFILEYTLSFL